jgi:4a-hydroxytetrahydrobiopterin dehydratase
MSEGLAQRVCEPCHGGTPPLSSEEANTLLGQLDGWRIDERGRLARTFGASDMVAAAELVMRIARIAEAESHHPDLRVTWRGVYVTIWTHAINALSINDFVLAAKIDQVVRGQTS